MFNRLISLINARSADSIGKPRRVLSAPLACRFPAERLGFVWQWIDRPWVRERELLNAYRDVFGELPPNSQRPGW